MADRRGRQTGGLCNGKTRGTCGLFGGGLGTYLGYCNFMIRYCPARKCPKPKMAWKMSVSQKRDPRHGGGTGGDDRGLGFRFFLNDNRSG